MNQKINMCYPIVSFENGNISAHEIAGELCIDEHIASGKLLFYRVDMNRASLLYELAVLIDKLQKSNICQCSNVVLEFTQPHSAEQKKLFDEMTLLAQNCGFQIAVIFTGINLPDIRKVKRLNLSYIKIASCVIERMQDSQDIKSILNSFVILGSEMNYKVIAEGVDTEDILRMVMESGIQYGQGGLFRYSQGDTCAMSMEVVNRIADIRKENDIVSRKLSLIRTAGDICKTGTLMKPEEKASAAYDLFEESGECADICVVDSNNKFIGLLTKADIMHAFGGRYGYSLHQRNRVEQLADIGALVVYRTFSIENVSRLAMERDIKKLYDPIVVLDNDDSYYGIVTIKDLLSATVSIEVEKANEANPLTSLPGNRTIEQKIHQLIGTKDFFAIMYLDLDNFKAYNDAYGFQNGDKMIQMLADAMRKAYGGDAFLGHVGGDDFVIITRQQDIRERAEHIIGEFKKNICDIYNETDWERGYIVAHSRKGEEEQFPIAAVSIAIVTNKLNNYERIIELNENIVTAKKKAKQIEGNSIVVL